MEMADIYVAALELSRKNSQVVGEKNDYFITLAQLERILAAPTHELTPRLEGKEMRDA